MRILIAAYTILAIAATARAAVQLATKAGEAPVPYTLSAAAALVYLVVGLALRTGRLGLAAAAAAVELVGVLAVGTAELAGWGSWPDETVWSGFGAGYGWTPLLLPVATLVVLRKRRPNG